MMGEVDNSSLSPPQTSQVKASEFYGFVAWIATSLAFVLFILWSFLPDEWIHWTGVHWYPSREWAILIPSYSCILALLVYFTYFALAFSSTPGFSDLSTITDTYAHIPEFDSDGRNPYLKYADPNAIPEVYDLPIGLVNRVLYDSNKGASHVS